MLKISTILIKNKVINYDRPYILSMHAYICTVNWWRENYLLTYVLQSHVLFYKKFEVLSTSAGRTQFVKLLSIWLLSTSWNSLPIDSLKNSNQTVLANMTNSLAPCTVVYCIIYLLNRNILVNNACRIYCMDYQQYDIP